MAHRDARLRGAGAEGGVSEAAALVVLAARLALLLRPDPERVPGRQVVVGDDGDQSVTRPTRNDRRDDLLRHSRGNKALRVVLRRRGRGFTAASQSPPRAVPQRPLRARARRGNRARTRPWPLLGPLGEVHWGGVRWGEVTVSRVRPRYLSVTYQSAQRAVRSRYLPPGGRGTRRGATGAIQSPTLDETTARRDGWRDSVTGTR